MDDDIPGMRFGKVSGINDLVLEIAVIFHEKSLRVRTLDTTNTYHCQYVKPYFDYEYEYSCSVASRMRRPGISRRAGLRSSRRQHGNRRVGCDGIWEVTRDDYKRPSVKFVKLSC